MEKFLLGLLSVSLMFCRIFFVRLINEELSLVEVWLVRF